MAVVDPVEIFIKLFLTQLSNASFLNSLKPPQNLNHREKMALRNLRSNKDIIITKADKGSSVVVLDTDDYITEALRQLNDTTAYTPLPHDPNPQFREEINQFLKQYGPEEGLTAADIAVLSPPNPKTPHFYLLPKLHKANYPGRPIVSDINSPTERISAFIDHHLQPIVTALPSYIKDTYHFLSLLNSVAIPSNSNILMATVDVTSLYTSIPHAEGLKALKLFLARRPTPHSP